MHFVLDAVVCVVCLKKVFLHVKGKKVIFMIKHVKRERKKSFLHKKVKKKKCVCFLCY